MVPISHPTRAPVASAASDAEHDHADARVDPAVALEHVGHGEPRQVRREGDGEVEAARDDRHQHGEA